MTNLTLNTSFHLCARYGVKLFLSLPHNLSSYLATLHKRRKNMIQNNTIYCRACNRYDIKSLDEDSPVCPICGARAQWENEVLLCI